MISSLFMGSPWGSLLTSFEWPRPRLPSQPGLIPWTQQKPVCPRRIRARLRHLRRPGFPNSAAEPESSSAYDSRARFAIYSNCKSIVSSVRGVQMNFFCRQETRQVFLACVCRKTSGNVEHAGRLRRGPAPRRSNASESPPLRRSCRPRPAEWAAHPTRACAARADARARARAPDPST